MDHSPDIQLIKR